MNKLHWFNKAFDSLPFLLAFVGFSEFLVFFVDLLSRELSVLDEYELSDSVPLDSDEPDTEELDLRFFFSVNIPLVDFFTAIGDFFFS